jgi:hypothetical protein
MLKISYMSGNINNGLALINYGLKKAIGDPTHTIKLKLWVKMLEVFHRY